MSPTRPKRFGDQCDECKDHQEAVTKSACAVMADEGKPACQWRKAKSGNRWATLIAKPLSTNTLSSFCTLSGTRADWEAVKGSGVPGKVSSYILKFKRSMRFEIQTLNAQFGLHRDLIRLGLHGIYTDRQTAWQCWSYPCREGSLLLRFEFQTLNAQFELYRNVVCLGLHGIYTDRQMAWQCWSYPYREEEMRQSWDAWSRSFSGPYLQ